MIYIYKCESNVCSKKGKETSISKPMMDSSKTEYCNVCHAVMSRVYQAVAISTGDGTKS